MSSPCYQEDRSSPACGWLAPACSRVGGAPRGWVAVWATSSGLC